MRRYAFAVLVLSVIGTVAASAAPSHSQPVPQPVLATHAQGGAGTVYADPVGDLPNCPGVAAVPDVSSVTVSNDAHGLISFTLTFAGTPLANVDNKNGIHAFIGIFGIDPATMPANYALDNGDGIEMHMFGPSLTGGNVSWSIAPRLITASERVLITTSQNSMTATVRLKDLRGVGDVLWFGMSVVAAVPTPIPNNGCTDFVPDNPGVWLRYAVSPWTAQPDSITNLQVRAGADDGGKTPAHGLPFGVPGVALTFDGIFDLTDNDAAFPGRADEPRIKRSCVAKVENKTVPLGYGRCDWTFPATSRGKHYTITVTVRYEGLTVRKVLTGVVR